MDKEECLKIIKEALDECFEEHGQDYLLGVGDSVPTTTEIISVIREHYEDSDLLEEFDSDDMMDFVESSWEYRRVEERIRKEYDKELADEIEALSKEEKRNILDVLENGHPDELWSLLADYGMCGNYDFEGIKTAFEKLKDKLSKSNYNSVGLFKTDE